MFAIAKIAMQGKIIKCARSAHEDSSIYIYVYIYPGNGKWDSGVGTKYLAVGDRSLFGGAGVNILSWSLQQVVAWAKGMQSRASEAARHGFRECF